MTGLLARLALAGLIVAWLVPQAVAQSFGGAFTGFSAESDEPIQIEADRLEVRDSEKLAVYSGNVGVRQGDTLLRTTELLVYYSGSGEAGPQGGALERIVANGRVVVTSNNRTASGERAVFEMADETAVLTGNVVLTEDNNILKGERLVVDLRTGQAQMDGGRVQTIIVPGRMQGGQGGGPAAR